MPPESPDEPLWPQALILSITLIVVACFSCDSQGSFGHNEYDPATGKIVDVAFRFIPPSYIYIHCIRPRLPRPDEILAHQIEKPAHPHRADIRLTRGFFQGCHTCSAAWTLLGVLSNCEFDFDEIGSRPASWEHD